MTDDELRDLIESAHQLQELARTPQWAQFLELASVELNKHRNVVLSGTLEPDRYRREAGFLAGGEMVMRIPEAVGDLMRAELQRRAEAEIEQQRISTDSADRFPG